MDEERNRELIQVVRLTIAICRAEVERSIDADLITLMDEGSPWGRAFMKTISEIKATIPAPSKGANL